MFTYFGTEEVFDLGKEKNMNIALSLRRADITHKFRELHRTNNSNIKNSSKHRGGGAKHAAKVSSS